MKAEYVEWTIASMRGAVRQHVKTRFSISLIAVGAAAAVAVVVALYVSPEAAYEGGTLTLIYTGDTYGELESCG
jgi:dihydroxyacid dehydratase/phosphogluconate dehydratase